MNTKKHGMLITIEGIDGSGKSTLAKNLHQQFIQHGIDTLLTREPGATQLGKALRTILQEKTVAVCDQAEYLLFAADRAQHFRDTIIPALANGTIIISDRMADSSLVYQGYGRGLSIEMIERINRWVMHDIQPDITVYVRVPVEVALERIARRQEKLTAFEQEKIEFTNALVYGFETVFANRDNVIIVDGRPSADEVLREAMEKVLLRIHAITQAPRCPRVIATQD